MLIFTIDGYYNTIMNMLPFVDDSQIYLWNIAIFAGNAGEDHELWLVDFRVITPPLFGW